MGVFYRPDSLELEEKKRERTSQCERSFREILMTRAFITLLSCDLLLNDHDRSIDFEIISMGKLFLYT